MKIPSKLFLKMMDLEAEYLSDPTLENFKKATEYQDVVKWPWSASQEQLEYWEVGMNHEAKQ
jgi:hypothetical protein